MGIMVVKGGVVLALLVAPAFALQFPAGVRRTSTVAFNDAVPTGAGLTAEDSKTSLPPGVSPDGPPSPFMEEEEEPPPSWNSPEWKWGSADGAAHEAAAKMRAQFAKRHRRTSFLAWAKAGTVDFGDLTLALALKCQQARNEGFDASDGRWESLMDDIAAADFNTDGPIIDQPKLAAEVNKRLPEPIEFEGYSRDQYPAAVCGHALEHLDFVEKGL